MRINIPFQDSMQSNIMKYAFSLRTNLVGDNPIRSSAIKRCINDWITSGPSNVQSLAVGGSTLTVTFLKRNNLSCSLMSCYLHMYAFICI